MPSSSCAGALSGHLWPLTTKFSHGLRPYALARSPRGSQSGPRTTSAPTFAETGLGGYQGRGWWGLAAPRGTPKPIVDQLNAEFVKLLKEPQFLAYLEKQAVLSAPTTTYWSTEPANPPSSGRGLRRSSPTRMFSSPSCPRRAATFSS